MADAAVRVMRGPVPLSVVEAESPRGGVVVVQEAFGVNAHIEDVCARFARAGWTAVAPHLFWRIGDPVFDYTDRERVMPAMATLDASGLTEDVDAALDEVGARGAAPDRTGIVGFCMGGSVALATGVRLRLGAAVTFYGGGVLEGRFGMEPLVHQAPRLQTPWLGLYGDADAGIPVEQVEDLRRAASQAAVDTEVVRYPDAGHGFHCDVRGSYHEPSAHDAWARTLGWLQAHIARPA